MLLADRLRSRAMDHQAAAESLADASSVDPYALQASDTRALIALLLLDIADALEELDDEC